MDRNGKMQTPYPHYPQVPNISQHAMADLLCTIMVLCKGQDGYGNPCWAYICIKPSMAQSFKEAREKGVFNLEDYGSVIEHGNGTEPPEDIRMSMERNYGMNHNYENKLLQSLTC